MNTTYQHLTNDCYFLGFAMESVLCLWTATVLMLYFWVFFFIIWFCFVFSILPMRQYILYMVILWLSTKIDYFKKVLEK